MSIFQKLNWFFLKEKKRYLLGILGLVLVAILQVFPPRIIGIVIDEINQPNIRTQTIFFWTFILLMTGVGQYLFRYIWRMNIWGGAALLEKTLRQRLFNHFTKMDRLFYQEHRTGDLMAHATNDLTAIQNVAGLGILTFADSFITGGATIIAMIVFVDWRLTLLALLPLPLLAWGSKVLGDQLHDAFTESQKAFSTINDKTQESITGIKVIKTFGQEKEDSQDFTEKIQQAIQKNKRVNFLDAMFDPLITVIVGLSYMITIIVGGSFILRQTLTIGQLISFISYIGMLIWPMFAIGRLFNVLERGNASYDRVASLLKKETTILEHPQAIKTAAAGDIDFDIHKFRYSGEAAAVLTDIKFHIFEGETLGIVGRTGAGKTTLLRLLMREADNYDGQIMFGGIDIRRYALQSLFDAIGYVPQAHFLFSLSIRENIRFANPSFSQEIVEKAATLAAIHSDIEDLPLGYDTLVGERGVSLSGGQKQRISIARALVLDPQLLILDDALSAVDAKTEAAILQNIKRHRKSGSTIIAAHRLSSVMHADEIIVLDEGEIIERGKHGQLLEKNGWYKKMWDRQQLEAKVEGEDLLGD
ncbi:ABC transporter ATP-binding protein [Enterococcus pallens]|uniref:Multidrug resistance-like ATP-binding protein mdlA n=1 Tax=Enterococcus pallens ATCC BAA-351 TaxID=1158607 RepID=R2QFX3_9ENTE|nr:ABC transporter transmembrane domain-containing protein [Enterococcus pallens]EOH94148.1 multidrug resistance-like ATP-binding protein mdlA [Enterococcus pallens ATCC BAA-351]EOU24027.1 multidrug resistance-like ATP-binding protein mdlA [Enterococcus pallens ATCC BAA-351]